MSTASLLVHTRYTHLSSVCTSFPKMAGTMGPMSFRETAASLTTNLMRYSLSALPSLEAPCGLELMGVEVSIKVKSLFAHQSIDRSIHFHAAEKEINRPHEDGLKKRSDIGCLESRLRVVRTRGVHTDDGIPHRQKGVDRGGSVGVDDRGG